MTTKDSPTPPLKILTAADIDAADDLPLELLEVPAWGGSVYVSGLTAEQFLALQKQSTIETLDEEGKEVSKIDTERFVLNLAALALVDGPARTRLYTGEAGKARLAKKSPVGVLAVFQAAQRLSAIGPAAAETIKGNSDRSTGTAASPV